MSDNPTPAVKPLLGMDLAQLQDVARQCGMPPFKARQIAQWLYRRGATELAQMTDLSLRDRQRLAQEGYVVGRNAPLKEARSQDGTVKYLFAGAPGRDVEAVFIPDRDRATLCVSSQAGCRMGCRFCMTGRQGLAGQLTPGQIINQVLSVPGSADLTNIVFMGMGEPTDNLPAVLRAIDILTNPQWGMAWSPRRITVSTIGNPQGLRRLLDETQVHIAISAHSPYPDERLGLMASQKAWPLHDTIDLLRQYDWTHQRRLSLEYILWRGLNDDLRHAHALARLIQGTAARVNLIPFHPIPGVDDLQPSDRGTMEAFRDTLNAQGITATIRASRGLDIMAACGMLAGQKTMRNA